MTTPLATLSPALLHAAAVFVSGSAVALVGLHTAILAIAGARSSLSPRARVFAPVIAALVLGGWLGWALVEAQQRALVGPGSGLRSPLEALSTLAAIVGSIVIGSAFLASRTMRTLNAAIPSDWLIRIQVYRTAGIMFIWPFMANGTLSAGFAVPAGIGDALTGLAAPFVALAVARRHPGSYRWAVAWNWFGIIDLVVAPIAAVLSGTQLVAIHPLGLIPLFLGPPLGILTHIYSLRNLAVNRTLLSPAPVTAG